MPFDAVMYLCCQACGGFVVEGEALAHERSCRDRRATHPLKELEIVLNAGVYHLDSQEDGGTDDACECLRTAAEVLNGYFRQLGFDDSGYPPGELAEAEHRIAERLQRMVKTNTGGQR
jgi:hypothetical protein